MSIGTGDKGDSGESFDYKFVKRPTKYAWDVHCTFKMGLGLRDLVGIMKNKTFRLLSAEDYQAHNFAVDEGGPLYFEPGPKTTPIPSMPAIPYL